MIINLAEIEYSKEYDHHFEATWFNNGVSKKNGDMLKANSEIFVKAEVLKFDGGFTFSGSVQFELTYECVRCIETCAVPFNCKLNVTLLPLKNEEADNSEDNEEINLHYYSTEDLDLSDVILQHLFLELPAYPLCSENCKGICQTCGINLNNETCFCDKEFINPKMAVLKNFKVVKN